MPIERERSIDPVRSHEDEGRGVHKTQLPGVSKQQLVERTLVRHFVNPEHLHKRHKSLAKNSYCSDSNAALEERIRLDEHIGTSDQRSPFRSEPPESFLVDNPPAG